MQATVEVTSRSMEVGTCRQAADHSNSAMEAQASGSYPAAGSRS